MMASADLTHDLARITEAELRSHVPRTQQVLWAGGREKACQKDLEECSYHIPALSSGSGKEMEQRARQTPLEEGSPFLYLTLLQESPVHLPRGFSI